MRTREKQIADLAETFTATGCSRDVAHEILSEAIFEAERRAEQRVRAEIGRDSERLDWFENNCASAKSQWVESQSVIEWQVLHDEWHPSFRAAIDAAREVG